ncbi:MAG: OFA family MFS transporter [Clostridiales bacterium]|jgi:OFA family oxalate/formate antiporter-like MFS transporter|nr:OFA family MFS transporter [Clostridiales bacterium]
MSGTSRWKPWVVLCVSFLINLIIGILYIWSIISKSLVNDLGWTSKQASLPYTFVTITFVIAMAIFGKLQDTRGPRITATIASVLLGIGIILSGVFVSPVMLVVTFGIIGGAGIGTANVATVPPAVKWFPPAQKGMVTGVSVAGIGISAVVYSPLANALLNSFGISKTFIYIGIGALILMLVLSQFLTNPPEGYVPQSDRPAKKQVQKAGPSAASTPVPDKSLSDVLKSSSFYRLWIMFMFSSSAGLMIIAHAANIAKFQITWEGGFYMVILLSVFNAAGRILGGLVSDKIGRINLMRIIFGLQAVNMLVFKFYSNIPLLAVGIAVAGLCYGAGFSVFPASVMDLFGMKNFGVNYGLIMTGWGLGGVIGPMMAAAVFDASKNYFMAYIIAGILLVVTLLISFTFRSRKAAKS